MPKILKNIEEDGDNNHYSDWGDCEVTNKIIATQIYLYFLWAFA